MATSGSYNFASTVTRNDIIDFALRKNGAKRRGMALTADEVSEAAFSLNLIVKQWAERSDGAPSLKMWLRKRIRIFLEDGKDQYDTGDSTDHIVAEDDLTTTAMRVAGVATDTAIECDSTTGMTAADQCGIVLDDGTMHWTTIASVTDADTFVIDDQLPSGAAIDNAIYTYTSNAQAPLGVVTSMLRYSNGNETPVAFDMSVEDYDAIFDKTVEGTVAAFYYERQRASGVFYCDVKSDTDLEELRLTVHYPTQDLDAAGDEADFPAQWLRALGWMLCIDMAPEYGIPVDPGWSTSLTEALTIAKGSDPETTDIFFEPERVG